MTSGKNVVWSSLCSYPFLMKWSSNGGNFRRPEIGVFQKAIKVSSTGGGAMVECTDAIGRVVSVGVVCSCFL